MLQTPLFQRAAAFAAQAHRDQIRKDGITPYFSHPVRVALTVACVFGFTDEVIIAAALLHDTIEDTNTDYDDILKQFGKPAADIVAVLTKDMRMHEPKREIAYDKQLAEGPWQGRLIKLADVYDNLCDTYSAASRRKILEKARRALKLAKKDRRLDRPRRIVDALVKSMKRRGR